MTDLIFRTDIGVELVQVNASDEMVVQAARASTQGRDARAGSSEADRGLIRFLVKNRHGSPTEHTMFTWRIEAPIFVAREAHRHRISSINEQSGRYMELLPNFYIPPASRPLVQKGKPGAYHFVMASSTEIALVDEVTREAYEKSWVSYQEMLERGIAKEVARIVLPVGTYTTWFLTMNARALTNFLSLRTTSDHSTFPSYPMYEISRMADQMEVAFKAHMPITWQAWDEFGRVPL